jgi:hypothetical protein
MTNRNQPVILSRERCETTAAGIEQTVILD